MDVKLNKTVLTVAAIIIVAGLSLLTVYTRAKLAETRSELEITKKLYGLADKEKMRLDSLRTFYMQCVESRDTMIAIKERENAKKDKEIALLRKSLITSLADVKKLTADSSYKYLQHRMAITALDSLIAEKEDLKFKYPFTGTQVKTIHYTFIERDGFAVMNDSLTSYVIDLKLLSSTKDNQITDLKSLSNVYKDKFTLCELQTGVYQTEVKDLNKEVRKQRHQKTASNLGMLGLVVVIIALIL